jgi:heme b synthase
LSKSPTAAHPASAPEEPARGYQPRIIAWEVTRRCLLSCRHCRAAARREPYPGEFTTDECRRLLENIASFARPILILTGGEPMCRPDIYEIASCASGLGLRVVMAPCGLLVDDEAVRRMVEAGIRRISISLDGATAESHDAFRGVPGAFDGAMKAVEAARRGGLDFQINTTVCTHNIDELPEILELAARLGASVFNPFLLVPTGRARELVDMEIAPDRYERVLHWLADRQEHGPVPIRVTCAPHYQRILRQRGVKTAPHTPTGCLGGKSFAFISHRGIVQICGFLEEPCGDIRAENYDFRKIWETSDVFLRMRDVDGYHGRCGYCEYRRVCGGCRARACAMTGDDLAEEPFCVWEPKTRPQASAPDPDPADDGLLLKRVQTALPVDERPWDALAGDLGLPADRILERLGALRQQGIVRRLGAVFDSRRLGYVSTLVAARVPEERIDEVARMVSDLPGVTHNYRREHLYNLWFTLTCPSEAALDATLDDLGARTGIDAFYSLPALAVYKIRVAFDTAPDEDESAEDLNASAPQPARESTPAPLTEADKALVRFLQESLPLVPRPFDEIARALGLVPADVVRRIRDWLDRGVIRRFGAVVGHRRLGFTANGMSVWDVPDESVDEVGGRLAACAEVSHVYRRPRLPELPCNLYAMVHGRDERGVRALVRRMEARVGRPCAAVLFSTTEFKKTSMKYFL